MTNSKYIIPSRGLLFPSVHIRWRGRCHSQFRENAVFSQEMILPTQWSTAFFTPVIVTFSEG